jgi:hypothetical protein
MNLALAVPWSTAMRAGVFVLGMHRSGTSAATNLIHLLGLPTARESDLVPATGENPKGYWESSSLVAFNTRVLEAVGSETGCPLALAPDWERDPRLEDLREEAPAAFLRVFPTAPWVWKDPRNCLTFSFWRRVLAVRPLAVLVYRNPLEIAASLRARSGENKIYTLALWERYLRQTLNSITGSSVLVTSYDEMIASPLGWCGLATAFLASQGLVVDQQRDDDLRAVVDESLRHTTFTRADLGADPGVSEAQRGLFEALEELRGAHDAFSLPPLPTETPTTEALLAERRRVVAADRELRRFQRLAQRPSRWARIRASRSASPARRIYAKARRLSNMRSAG